MAVKNSATTAPISARPAASRSAGEEIGRRRRQHDLEQLRSRRERNERATSTYSRGTARAPSATLTMIENSAANTMVASRAAPV